jgi:hypothetical protein
MALGLKTKSFFFSEHHITSGKLITLTNPSYKIRFDLNFKFLMLSPEPFHFVPILAFMGFSQTELYICLLFNKMTHLSYWIWGILSPKESNCKEETNNEKEDNAKESQCNWRRDG